MESAIILAYNRVAVAGENTTASGAPEYLSGSVEDVIVLPSAPVKEARVLPPDFLSHTAPVVDEAHEALDFKRSRLNV